MNLIDPTLIYLKASFATTAKTYQSLPSEFIFFSSFTMVKPGFCAKISSQISDPQKTTVHCLVRTDDLPCQGADLNFRALLPLVLHEIYIFSAQRRTHFCKA